MDRVAPVGAVLLLLCASGCADGAPGFPDPLDPLDGVGDGEPYQAQSCDDIFYGEPVVRLGEGTGGYSYLADGDEIPIGFGGQSGCGYHVEFGLETENLCPILWIDYQVELLGLDDAVEPIAIDTRHIQFVREAPGSSLQQIWALKIFIPPEHYPTDPPHADQCPPDAGSAGHCDEVDMYVTLTVEDHDGRTASLGQVVRPSYDP